jgi:hypothetical protein
MNPEITPENTIPNAENLSRYTGAAVVFLRIGTNEFDLNFSEATSANWQTAMELLYYVDDLVDTPGQDGNAALRDLQHALLGTDAVNSTGHPTLGHPIPQLIETLKASNRPEQIHAFLREGEQIMKINKAFKDQSYSVRRFGQLTRAEGRHVTNMLLSLTHEEDTQQPRYTEFARCMRAVGSVGNLLDTIVDLEGDYDSGISKIRPTISNRLRLVSMTYPDTINIAKSLGKKRTLRLARGAMASTFRDRLKNR